MTTLAVHQGELAGCAVDLIAGETGDALIKHTEISPHAHLDRARHAFDARLARTGNGISL